MNTWEDEAAYKAITATQKQNWFSQGFGQVYVS